MKQSLAFTFCSRIPFLQFQSNICHFKDLKVPSNSAGFNLSRNVTKLVSASSLARVPLCLQSTYSN